MRQATPEDVRISHIGIAVTSIADALPFYKEILGIPEVELAQMDGARITGLETGNGVVELLEPRENDSPVGKFIARRGPGIHHICFEVPDLDGTLERCRAKGIKLIDEAPRVGAEGKRIAFLHPAATGGILIELTER